MTPSKGAKEFFAEAGRFMEIMGRYRGNKEAGADVLRFGRSEKCFSIKDGEDVRMWDDDEKEEFMALIRAKLQ